MVCIPVKEQTLGGLYRSAFMASRSIDPATDCIQVSTDWTTIGARILKAALIASAIHAEECRRNEPGHLVEDRDFANDRRQAGPAWE